MLRPLALLYGLLAYAAFLLTISYAVGFLANTVVPKSIDAPATGDAPTTAALINVALLGLFGLQHSVMARQGFKRRWTRLVSWPIERSTFVLITCAVLALLFWQWRSMPTALWSVEHPALRFLLHAVSAAGWLLVLYSSALIDHFELFGIRQVWRYYRAEPHPHPPFRTPSLYRFVRHPLYLGFFLAFWATPDMTHGRLLFAAVAAAYVLVAIRLEERDLLARFGDDYRQYRARTPMILPIPRAPAASRATENA